MQAVYILCENKLTRSRCLPRSWSFHVEGYPKRRHKLPRKRWKCAFPFWASYGINICATDVPVYIQFDLHLAQPCCFTFCLFKSRKSQICDVLHTSATPSCSDVYTLGHNGGAHGRAFAIFKRRNLGNQIMNGLKNWCDHTKGGYPTKRDVYIGLYGALYRSKRHYRKTRNSCGTNGW